MKSLEQAFQCADLLLQGSGGFAVIIIDLSDLPERFLRKVSLTTWFRFRAVVEKQETALVFSTPHAVTSTCSELMLALSAESVQWSQATELCPTHARVLARYDFQAEITRKRSFRKPLQPASHTLRSYPRLA